MFISEENNILGMVNDKGYLEPTVFGNALIGEADYVDYYDKDKISVAEIVDILKIMDFKLSVVEINEQEEYITLDLTDMQDNHSSMNYLEFEVNIKDEETIRQEMYEILIGNFECYLDDYGYVFI